MGFYGKVNHSDKVNFTIDKVYASRKEMEDAVQIFKTDDVALGRYVLIEYGMDLNAYPRVYSKDEKETDLKLYYLYHLPSFEEKIKYLAEKPELDENPRYWENGYAVLGDKVFVLNTFFDQEFYECVDQKDGLALFQKISKPADANGDYYNNFYKDLQTYGNSRGFDSTVWQKNYVDGKEKYVMIAELNSVVPTFGLTIDAPSDVPDTPHFDADSTSVYYRLHVQPAWGFRLKDAGAGPSDDKGDNKKAIYFNEAGFYPANAGSYVDKDNEITITKAKSGQLYNTHNKDNPFETAPAEDIQELSIMLPELGNAVSKMWDIVYGEERIMNIGWNSTEGLRLTNKDSGYDYNETAIETLAGCINTAHDLIGMVVKDDINKDEIDKADTRNIYYGDFDEKGYNSYYIKSLYYEYPPFKDDEELQQWINDRDYVELVEFSEGEYYVKTNEGYKKDTTKQYRDGTSYFSITAEDIQLDGTYAPHKYYYLNEKNLNYLLDENNNPNENIQYYEINFIPKTTLSNAQTQTYFYNPKPHVENEDGTWTGYFYKPAENEIEELTGEETDPDYNSELKYFIGQNYNISYEYVDIDGKTELRKTYDFGPTKEKLIPVNLIPLTYDPADKTGNYYFVNENNEYICLTSKEDIDDSISYGKLILTPKTNKFYEPNLYYYRFGNDFIFATSAEKEDKNYVILNGHTTPLTQTFYQPNTYYYEENGIDKIDTNLVMSERDYFIKYFAYVDKDERGILDRGAEWNSKVTSIPEGVKLAKRIPHWGWKELVGFGQDLNTVMGLIIRINNLIKFDDVETRNLRTVQGCINKMNDIINTFATLIPGELMIVDSYGRMTSSTWETNEWISLEINDDPVNHSITLIHTGPVESNETKKDDLTPAFGETFNIEDWYFDEKGHRSNKTEHTIMIPKGSLEDTTSINAANVLTSIDFTPSTGAIKTTHENLSQLTLTGYEKINNNADVSAEDTLSVALSKLQTQIIEEETTRANAISDTMDSLNKAIEKEVADRNAAIKIETDARIEAINKEVIDRNAAIKVETDARIAAINALDATITTENAEVITSITQTDGLVTAGKKKVGELTLTGWTLGESVVNNESIADTDTVNNAFAKAQRQINANKVALTVLNGDRSTKGSVAYQIAEMVINADEGGIDKLEEIAAWIVSDTTGAAKMNSDIKINADAIDALELLVGNTAVATQIINAINNALLVDGVDKYALAADLINLSTTVSNINDRVEDLELIVSPEKVSQWDAAEANVQSDWAETDETADSYIKNKPILNFVSVEAYNTLLERIATLEARIEALENPKIEEPTPDPENPEEPVE